MNKKPVSKIFHLVNLPKKSAEKIGHNTPMPVMRDKMSKSGNNLFVLQTQQNFTNIGKDKGYNAHSVLKQIATKNAPEMSEKHPISHKCRKWGPRTCPN
jgi:hypothetical protein